MSQDKFYSDTVSDKLTGEEEFVSGVTVGEPPAYTPNKYYCTNCRRSVHNGFYGDTVCKRNGCKCKCQTHYQGRAGYLIPYGIPDYSKIEDIKTDPAQDAFIEKLNREWRKLNPETPVKKEDFYS